MDPVTSACGSVFEQINEGGRILVGFSGGMDSTVLLHALVQGAQATVAGAQIVALHVDHGLATDSGRWRDHCASVADRLGVEFITQSLGLESGSNLESRARAGRYGVFTPLLGPDDVLLLAHHCDDQDESILMHLLQGRGLFGIPAQRSLGAGRLLRPLLELPRSTLRTYADQQALEWLQDPGNEDMQLDRNFIRRRLLPGLKERFPELSGRLARVMNHVARTDTALAEALGLQRNPLPLGVLAGLSAAAAGTVLRHWLVVQHASAGVSDVALEEFGRQLTAPTDRQPSLKLPVGSLRRFRGNLYLLGSAPRLHSSYAVSVPDTLALPHGLLTLTLVPDAAGLEAEAGRLPAGPWRGLVQVQEPVRVTFAPELAPGTRFQINGHARKVSELMREAGLPPWVRDVQPLLMDSHGLVAITSVAVRDRPSVSTSEMAAALDCRISWCQGVGAQGPAEDR